MNTNVLAWYFAAADKRLRYGDGRKIRKGVTHKVYCEPVLCEAGLHASVGALDALKYAPGPIVCRVKLGGKIVKGHDKCVATERTYIAVADATRTLHEFAIWCAERALKRAGVTDERCWNALRVKRLWLDGEATDKELYAASDAAASAASAASDASNARAAIAAWAASDAAASDASAASAARAARAAIAAWAAWAASDASAASAASDASNARAAERKAQNRKLTAMLNKLIRSKKCASGFGGTHDAR